MGRWGSAEHQQPEAKSNFNTMIQKDKLTALQLIQSKNFIEEVKDQNEVFTELILQKSNEQLLNQFVDIALRPQYFMNQHQVQIDKEITHAAIEVLTSLDQDFMEWIFSDGKEEKMEEVDEDEVVMEKEVEKQPTQEICRLDYFLKVLEEKQRQPQTCLAYLAKIITPLIYHKSEEIINTIVKNPKYIKNFVSHLYSISISDFIGKMFEMDNDGEFYQNQKIGLFRTIIAAIDQQSADLLPDFVENFKEILVNLYEKLEDRFDKYKYHNLCKDILGDKQFVQTVLKKMEQFFDNHEIKLSILEFFQIYFNFFIKKAVKPTKANSSFGNDNSDASCCEPFSLSPEIINEFQKFIRNHSLQQYCSSKKKQLIKYCILLKSLMTIEHSTIEKIVTKQFLNQMFELMKLNQSSNILHNIQKKIIQNAISECDTVYQMFASKEIDIFYKMLESNLSKDNSSKSFENQLYCITNQIQKKEKQNNTKTTLFDTVADKLQEKKKFYDTLIGETSKDTLQVSWQAENVFFSNFKSNFPDIKIKEVSEEITTSNHVFDFYDKEQVLSEDDDHKQSDHFLECDLPIDSEGSQSNYQSSNEYMRARQDTAKSKSFNFDIELIHEKDQDDDEMTAGNSNSQFFGSYLSYNVDNLLDDL